MEVQVAYDMFAMLVRYLRGDVLDLTPLALDKRSWHGDVIGSLRLRGLSLVR